MLRVICLVFFSDDVLISGDFVTQIVTKMEKNSRMLLGGEIIDYPAGWNEFEISDGRNIYITYCNGWLLSATKSAWEESGGFDPIYKPFDVEDVDLSTRFSEMGYNLSALNSKYLHHIGGATIGSLGLNVESIQKTQRIVYQQMERKTSLYLRQTTGTTPCQQRR